MIKGIQDAMTKTSELRHPLHDLLDLINKTPADMIKMKFEQGEDGSKTFNIQIPSRAEQAKQKAMEQAMQQQSAPVAETPGAVEDIQPSENVTKMPSPKVTEMVPEEKAVAASKNVQIRVAMTKDVKALKTVYPSAFLKAMDLK